MSAPATKEGALALVARIVVDALRRAEEQAAASPQSTVVPGVPVVPGPLTLASGYPGVLTPVSCTTFPLTARARAEQRTTEGVVLDGQPT